MEKIISRKELLEMLENMKAVEEKARDSYVEDTVKFNNEKIVYTIKKIKEDEDKHINILKGLIEMLKNATESK